MKNYYIYILICPVDNTIRYVGVTVTTKSSLKQHMVGHEGILEKIIWINSLKKNKLKPILEVVAVEKSKDMAHHMEALFIQKYAKEVHPIFNGKLNPNRPNPRKGISFNQFVSYNNKADKLGISIYEYMEKRVKSKKVF